MHTDVQSSEILQTGQLETASVQFSVAFIDQVFPWAINQNNWRVPLLLVLSLLGSSSACAQFTSGTTIVFAVSQEKLVVAADSLNRSDVPEHRNDRACKIIALGDDLLFTAAGFAAQHHTVLTRLDWSAFDEAIKAFSAHKKSAPTGTSQDAVDDVSRRWMLVVKQRYSQLERRDVRRFLGAADGNVVIDATFIGAGPDGKIKAREVSITFDRDRAVKSGYGAISATNQLWDIPEHTILKAGGHTEIAYEFSAQSSDRARKEAKNWELELLRHPGEDRDVLNVIHLVRLTILNAPKEWGVGGPIDVAEFTPTTGIRWIQRKPECPSKSAPAIH